MEIGKAKETVDELWKMAKQKAQAEVPVRMGEGKYANVDWNAKERNILAQVYLKAYVELLKA